MPEKKKVLLMACTAGEVLLINKTGIFDVLKESIPFHKVHVSFAYYETDENGNPKVDPKNPQVTKLIKIDKFVQSFTIEAVLEKE
jgi:hypothetical protein